MKKILVLIMSIVMVFAMTACGGGEPVSDDVPVINVTLEIDFPDGSGIEDIEAVDYEAPKGATVYEVLAAYAAINDIEIGLEQSGGIDCVTNIGGVTQTDSMGWIYQVNDKDVMDTATECIVNDGDVIEWETTEW